MEVVDGKGSSAKGGEEKNGSRIRGYYLILRWTGCWCGGPRLASLRQWTRAGIWILTAPWHRHEDVDDGGERTLEDDCPDEEEMSGGIEDAR